MTADEMADYTWLRPEVEAEIKYAEWTSGRLLRHAEFVTLYIQPPGSTPGTPSPKVTLE